jgi:hypothetical protein
MEGPLSASRRDVLKFGAGAALMSAIGELAWAPQRLAMAAGTTLPNIQFDIGNFIAPAQTINGVSVRFGPVFVLFMPIKLTRTPTRADQTTLANA